MKILSARNLRQGLYPLLELDLEGLGAAQLDAYPKPTLFAAGFVYLGYEFEGRVPDVPFHPKDGGPTTLRGCTSDAGVLALYNAFLDSTDDGSFKVGRVELPAA
jgi:hypothetical protein